MNPPTETADGQVPQPAPTPRNSTARVPPGRLPLCAKYASVHARFLSACVEDRGTERTQYIPWMLGATLDGEREVLGAWPQLATESDTAALMAADLAARGVESVRVLHAGADLTLAFQEVYPSTVAIESLDELRATCLSLVPQRKRHEVSKGLNMLWAARSYAEAVVRLEEFERGAWSGLQAIGSLCRRGLQRSQAFYSLPRRVRHVSLQAEELVPRLQRIASVALLRRGCFASPEDAAAFGEFWLTRGERQVRRSASARESRQGRSGKAAPLAAARSN